jgi:hypothetical protein
MYLLAKGSLKHINHVKQNFKLSQQRTTQKKVSVKY